MKFQPKTEQEIIAEKLWPEGLYNFQIGAAIEAVSQSGNDMIKLTVNCVNSEGRSIIVFDYLLESMAFKLIHCAQVCGLMSKYTTGHLEAIDFEGKTGTLRLGIQKDKTGQYSDKNIIKDYIVDKKITPAQEKHTQDKGNAFVNNSIDDDLPF